MNLGARGDGSRRFAGYPCALGPSGDPRLGQAPDTEQGEDGRDKGRHTGLGGRSQAREVALLPCGNSESLKMREMCTITAPPPPRKSVPVKVYHSSGKPGWLSPTSALPPFGLKPAGLEACWAPRAWLHPHPCLFHLDLPGTLGPMPRSQTSAVSSVTCL